MTDINTEETLPLIFDNGSLREMSEAEILEMEKIAANVVIPVPSSIEMRQLRLKLLNDKTLKTIDDAVTALSAKDENIKIEWEYSIVVPIDGVLFTFIATTLKLNEQAVKDFFIEAVTL